MIYVLSGGTSLFAVIAVTYPSGSICTCGGKAAKDTSGFALFNVKAGTYTVECHTSDNSKSKSTSVTVADSDKGKCKNVKLSYELVLYDNGTDNTALTGGWVSYGNCTVTKESAYMTIEGSASYASGSAGTVNAIDLTEYKTIEFDVKISQSLPSNYGWLGVSKTKTTNQENLAVKKDFSTSTSRATISIDVSTLTGNYYPVIGTFSGDSNPTTYIYSVKAKP